jgi:5-methylthioadenosine/S-adenosylhomocysteine deaminase
MSNNPARILFKGGIVITMDRAIGDLTPGDVLTDGAHIAAVGRDLGAQAGDARIVDCGNKIVLPGFVDTHRRGRHAPRSGDVPQRAGRGGIP